MTKRFVTAKPAGLWQSQTRRSVTAKPAGLWQSSCLKLTTLRAHQTLVHKKTHRVATVGF